MEQAQGSDMIEDLCHRQLEEFMASYDSPSTDVKIVKQSVSCGGIIEELCSKQLDEFVASCAYSPSSVKPVTQPVPSGSMMDHQGLAVPAGDISVTPPFVLPKRERRRRRRRRCRISRLLAMEMEGTKLHMGKEDFCKKSRDHRRWSKSSWRACRRPTRPPACRRPTGPPGLNLGTSNMVMSPQRLIKDRDREEINSIPRW